MQGCYHYQKIYKTYFDVYSLKQTQGPHFFALMNLTLFSVRLDAFVSVWLFSQIEYFISVTSPIVLGGLNTTFNGCTSPLQPASALSQAINTHCCVLFTLKNNESLCWTASRLNYFLLLGEHKTQTAIWGWHNSLMDCDQWGKGEGWKMHGSTKQSGNLRERQSGTGPPKKKQTQMFPQVFWGRKWWCITLWVRSRSLHKTNQETVTSAVARRVYITDLLL